MEPGEIAGRTVGTGVNVASGVGDGVIGASEGETGFGDGDFLGDGVGDAFDFFFPDDGFPFFFFAGVGVFLGVGFFFLGDAFGFGLGDFLGLGEVFATASGFSSDETCAEAGVAARSLAKSSHKQKRATAHVTKKGISGGPRRRSRVLQCTLVFAAQNRVQFSAQQQQ